MYFKDEIAEAYGYLEFGQELLKSIDPNDENVILNKQKIVLYTNFAIYSIRLFFFLKNKNLFLKNKETIKQKFRKNILKNL